MKITHKLSLAVLTLGIAVSSVGCSVAAHPVNVPTSVASASATPDAAVSASASPEISPTTEASAPTTTTTATPVETIAAVPVAEPPAPAAVEPVVEVIPEPVAAAPAPAVVAAPAPVQKAPAPAPAAVQAAPAPVQAPPVQAPPAVSREVYVGLAGGQAVVDQGRGPVLFPLPGGFPPYVAEHDMAGGWARFGTLSPGMTVRMTGLVGGTYTVGQIINVPKGGSTAELRQFSTTPKVMLQTCIPGTSRMIVVGLY